MFGNLPWVSHMAAAPCNPGFFAQCLPYMRVPMSLIFDGVPYSCAFVQQHKGLPLLQT